MHPDYSRGNLPQIALLNNGQVAIPPKFLMLGPVAIHLPLQPKASPLEATQNNPKVITHPTPTTSNNTTNRQNESLKPQIQVYSQQPLQDLQNNSVASSQQNKSGVFSQVHAHSPSHQAPAVAGNIGSPNTKSVSSMQQPVAKPSDIRVSTAHNNKVLVKTRDVSQPVRKSQKEKSIKITTSPLIEDPESEDEPDQRGKARRKKKEPRLKSTNPAARSKTQNIDKIQAPAYVVYTYSVIHGNNHELIERMLSNRSWWKKAAAQKQTNKDGTPAQKVPVQFYWRMMVENFNFKQIASSGGSYMSKKSMNRFQKSDEISDKDNFFRNIWHLCQRTGDDIFNYVPLTFSFRMKEIQYEKDIQEFCRVFLANERKCSVDQIKPIRSFMDESLKEEVNIYYDFKFPFLTRNINTRKFHNIESHEINQLPDFFAGRNMWIIKPSGCDRGKGVEIFRSLEELGKFISLYTSGYNMSEYMNMNYDDHDNTSPTLKEGALMAKTKTTAFPKFVIQKYMERPALFKGYKFDIRTHALLTQDKQLFIFRESYIRICSLPYDVERNNYFAHLCNTAVNMRSSSFGKLAEANCISAIELADYFQQKEAGNSQVQRLTGGDFEEYFFEQAKRLIKITFDSVLQRANLVNPNNIPNTFELYGFDMMVDESYRCWLIEANYIPGLTDDGCAYAKDYMERMIDDMFKLTIDEMYPMPRNGKRSVEQYPLMNYPSSKNLWIPLGKYE